MTANPAKIQRLLWKQETNAAAWAENATSMSSPYVVPVTGTVNYQINQPMVDTMRTVQYRNEGTLGAPGVWDISMDFEFYLTGYGSTTAGAVSVQDHHTFWGWLFGGGPTRTFAAGTTISGGSSTTTDIDTTASGTGAAGGLFRVGAKGDGGADGQGNVIDTHVANDLVTEVAFAAAPANGAVVYSAVNVYTVEDATSSSIIGARTLLFTANQQIMCHGVYPTAVTLSGFNGGEFLKARASLRGSWAEMRADTFPNADTMATISPAPNAAGSLHIGAYGSTTRAAYSYRDMTVDFTLGVQALKGADGVNPYQDTVGARRTVDKCLVTVTLDAPAAATSPTWWAAFVSNGWYQILWTGTAADGQTIMAYWPRCRLTGNRPTQGASGDLNSVTIQFEAHTDTGETGSALALSMFRLGSG